MVGMTNRLWVPAALAALFLGAAPAVRADNMASIAIAPGSAAVTLVPHWGIGSGLGGFTFLAQDLGLGAPGQFYSTKGTAIPVGGDPTAFTRYDPLSGVAVAHADIGGKLTPDSYSGLTSADPNLGFGAINLYMIHHRPTGDYFTALVPGAAVASVVEDLKPMSVPGGPQSLGGTGYFALTFCAANLGFGANMIYYLRTDPTRGTIFGAMNPALALGPVAEEALGVGGHVALAYAFPDMGWGLNQMYTLRLDPVTGYTIFGTLGAATGVVHDIANLGSVFTTLSFFPADLGFSINQFYVAGSINPGWQSVSFAPIADRAIAAGSFTVTPSASSGLPLTLTLAATSSGAASITGPVGGVFTVKPLGPGLIVLQAAQAGQTAPTAYEANALSQAFNATGASLLAFTAQPSPLSQIALVGGSASFTAAATGTTAVTYQWLRAGTAITGNASAATARLTLANVEPSDAASYAVVATNAAGSVVSNGAVLVVHIAIPVVTNTPLTASGRVSLPFDFFITATNSPATYMAASLPAGLSLNTATGEITGSPLAVGVTTAVIGASNPSGTGTASLIITVQVSGAPVVVQAPSGQTAVAGQTAVFAVTSSATPAPGYQWQILGADSVTWVNLSNGPSYAGVTGPTMTVTLSPGVLSGSEYRAVITNTVGQTATLPVALTVVGAGPKLLHFPTGIAVDPAGNFYVADTSDDTIERITAAGAVSTLAGVSGSAGSQDGTGSGARFNEPLGVALDSAGNLYVADSANGVVRRITPSGVVTTLAGAATVRGSADGAGSAASFGMPTGLAIDAAGNIYVADAQGQTVRGITAAGLVRTLAGSPGVTGEADGTGSAARFNYPCGVAVDTAGVVYVADCYNDTIRKLTPAGVVTTLAGSAGLPGNWDGVGAYGLFRGPTGVAVDSTGTVYVADCGNQTIRLVAPDGTVITLAGNPVIAGLADGIGEGALFNQPRSVVVVLTTPLTLPDLYITDAANAGIRHLSMAYLTVNTLLLTPAVAGASGNPATPALVPPVEPRVLIAIPGSKGRLPTQPQ